MMYPLLNVLLSKGRPLSSGKLTIWFTLSLEAEGSAGQEVVPWDLQEIQVNKFNTQFSKVTFFVNIVQCLPKVLLHVVSFYRIVDHFLLLKKVIALNPGDIRQFH
jgi:hypothetical protein